MQIMQIISSSEKITRLIAEKLAKKLRGGEIIGLIGNLGAGKTIFTKGLAAGLGVKKNVTSPTFVLMKIYPIKPHPARSLPKAKLLAGVNPADQPRSIRLLVHLDAYRIKSAQDLIAIGANEYFNRLDTVTVIEWADKIKKILPKKTKFINITYKNGSRIIKF